MKNAVLIFALFFSTLSAAQYNERLHDSPKVKIPVSQSLGQVAAGSLLYTGGLYLTAILTYSMASDTYTGGLGMMLLGWGLTTVGTAGAIHGLAGSQYKGNYGSALGGVAAGVLAQIGYLYLVRSTQSQGVIYASFLIPSLVGTLLYNSSVKKRIKSETMQRFDVSAGPGAFRLVYRF